jgi:hypothetical protein
MGFLTNISISNDFWHEIAKDPQKLVDAISVGMNDGIDGPLFEVFQGGRWSKRAEYVRRQTPQGVTIHRARHYDDPQVIVNTYGSHAIAAHELPYAINPMGDNPSWIDLNPYHREHAEKVAKTLEDQARHIRQALAHYNKRKAQES